MTDFNKKMMTTSAFLIALTIAFGAFGAHGLKQLVGAEAIITFETGVRYQMYHALAIFALSFAPVASAVKKWTFWFFILGIVCFSGSIYLLSLKEVLNFNVRFLGPITPLGGLLFIVGWLRLAIGLLTVRRG